MTSAFPKTELFVILVHGLRLQSNTTKSSILHALTFFRYVSVEKFSQLNQSISVDLLLFYHWDNSPISPFSKAAIISQT